MLRLIISEESRDWKTNEKIFGFIPNSRAFRSYYISVKPPEEKEILTHLADRRLFPGEGVGSFQGMTENEFEKLRMIKIQEIVNNLTKEGYFVKTDQFSLFLKGKINNLIMEKK